VYHEAYGQLNMLGPIVWLCLALRTRLLLEGCGKDVLGDLIYFHATDNH
jgi:hypothetical protein